MKEREEKKLQKVEAPGIEPGASRMLSERSTTELRPQSDWERALRADRILLLAALPNILRFPTTDTKVADFFIQIVATIRMCAAELSRKWKYCATLFRSGVLRLHY